MSSLDYGTLAMAGRRRIYNPRKIRNVHLNIPEFKGWLREIPDGDGTKVSCWTCKRIIKAGLTSIRRHMGTNLHRKSAMAQPKEGRPSSRAG